MKQIETHLTAWEVYDPLSTPTREFKKLGGLLCFFAFCFSTFWWDHYQLILESISCFLCPAILLALPRLTRSAFLAYRGAPLFCFSERGFWSRDWYYLGWIDWKNVSAVNISTDYTGTRHSIAVRLSQREFAHLTIHDRVFVVLIRWLSLFLSVDEGENTLQIAGASELTCSGADFITTINRVLVNAHVYCKRNQTFPAS